MTTLAAPAGDTVDRCGPVRRVPELNLPTVRPTVGELDPVELAAVFKALGSTVRLRLLAVVQATPGGESCVCDLVDRLGVSQSTVSHHLAVLVAAGLLRREQRGTWAWYALMPQRLADVRHMLGG